MSVKIKREVQLCSIAYKEINCVSSIKVISLNKINDTKLILLCLREWLTFYNLKNKLYWGEKTGAVVIPWGDYACAKSDA